VISEQSNNNNNAREAVAPIDEFEKLFNFDRSKPQLIANQYDMLVEQMLMNESPATNQSIVIKDSDDEKILYGGNNLHQDELFYLP